LLIIDMIWYIYLTFNRNWVDTRWQQYITHLHINNTHNTEKVKFGKCGPCPAFVSYTLAFALQLRIKHGNTSVRVTVTVAVDSNVTHLNAFGNLSESRVCRKSSNG
jgi:hypothetical protein